MAKKAIQPRDLVIRCHAELEPDGSWFAMCVDLNLCAQAGTLEEVKQHLQAIAHDYVLDALTEYRDTPDLLRRRAPMGFVVRYHVIAMQCWIGRWLERRAHQKLAHTHERYNQTVPMIPAPC